MRSRRDRCCPLLRLKDVYVSCGIRERAIGRLELGVNSDALIGLSVIGAANALCHLFNNTYLETLRHHVKVSKMSSAKTEGSFPHAAVALGDTHTLAKQTKQQVSRCQASDSVCWQDHHSDALGRK